MDQFRRKRELFRRHKEYHRIFNLWRDFDLITTIITISGLFLAIVNYEIESSRHTSPINIIDYPDANSHPRVSHAQTNLVRLSIMISNIFAVACMFARHYYKYTWTNNFRENCDERIFFQYNSDI